MAVHRRTESVDRAQGWRGIDAFERTEDALLPRGGSNPRQHLLEPWRRECSLANSRSLFVQLYRFLEPLRPGEVRADAAKTLSSLFSTARCDLVILADKSDDVPQRRFYGTAEVLELGFTRSQVRFRGIFFMDDLASVLEPRDTAHRLHPGYCVAREFLLQLCSPHPRSMKSIERGKDALHLSGIVSHHRVAGDCDEGRSSNLNEVTPNYFYVGRQRARLMATFFIDLEQTYPITVARDEVVKCEQHLSPLVQRGAIEAAHLEREQAAQ